MVEEFIHKLKAKEWLQPEHRILLAVSGGIDSAVMAHLFSRSPYTFGIAHCNFKLRGSDSDGDETFVRQLATQLQVPFFSASFDTEALAKAHHQSIQMEARDLRYSWLEDIREKENFQWIATAHHLNDSIETIFYNFAKGCGIRGLQGIPERNGYIIRPLLPFAKEAIIQFQKAYKIAFREDYSNAEDKYARNKIRHHLLPVMEAINPSFVHTASQNIERLKDAADLMNWAVETIKDSFFQQEKDHIRIKKAGLEGLLALETVMYEWLHPMGFNGSQVNQLLQNDSGQPGRLFESTTHTLLDDRDYFIITPHSHLPDTEAIFTLDWNAPYCKVTNGRFLIEKKTAPPSHFPKDPHTAYLHLEPDHFPLRIRHWQAGDTFQPLGMKGHHQKVQDFFTNQKATRIEKKRIWLVETRQGEICWIVGHRIDERFKLVSTSEHFVSLTFIAE